MLACCLDVPTPQVGSRRVDVPIYECPVGGCFSFSEALGERMAMMR